MNVFTDLKPNESYLYHYTSAATLGLILDSGQLRLGPYSKTNDPRENLKFPTFIMRSGQDLRLVDTNLDRLNAEIDYAIRGRARLTCLTRDRPSAEEDAHFHRGWARARMWDNYADRHRGACIMFDESALRRAIQNAAGKSELHDASVEYLNDWSAGVPEVLLRLEDLSRHGITKVADKVVAERWRDLFFRKNDDWATEGEYRFVVVDDREEALDADIREALVAVAIGMDFPHQDASVLRYRLDRLGVPTLPVRQVDWTGGRPFANPSELVDPPTSQPADH